jgi:hypothetical protein
MHVMLVTHRMMIMMVVVMVVVVDLISVAVVMMMMTLVIYTMVIIDFLHRVSKLDVLHSHLLVVITMVPMAATVLPIRPVVPIILVLHHSCNHNRQHFLKQLYYWMQSHPGIFQQWNQPIIMNISTVKH